MHQTGLSCLGITTLIITYILTSLATLLVALRFYCRRLQGQRAEFDDWLIVASAWFNWGELITMSVWIVDGGFGWHRYELSDAQLLTMYKCFTAHQVCYVFSAALMKWSVLLFYKRIFDLKQYRIVAMGIGFLVLLWFLANFFGTIFECVPPSLAWTLEPRGNRCLDWLPYIMTQSGSNVALDLLILCLPIRFIFKLKLTMRKRVAIYSIFLMGGFVVVAGALRLVFLAQAPNVLDVYHIAFPGLWTMIETSVGVISACLPVLYPLLNKFVKKTIGTVAHASKSAGRSAKESISARSRANASSTDTAAENSGLKEISSDESGNPEKEEAPMDTQPSHEPLRHPLEQQFSGRSQMTYETFETRWGSGSTDSTLENPGELEGNFNPAVGGWSGFSSSIPGSSPMTSMYDAGHGHSNL